MTFTMNLNPLLFQSKSIIMMQLLFEIVGEGAKQGHIVVSVPPCRHNLSCVYGKNMCQDE
jgi:hypothetical protein